MKHILKVRKTNKTYFEERAEKIQQLKELRAKRFNREIKHVLMIVFMLIIIVIAFDKIQVGAIEEVEVIENIEKTTEIEPVLIEEVKNDVVILEEKTVAVIEEKVLYKDIEEKAFEFIIKFEGYHDKPYWDHKQYSCGYGMRCSKDTTGITKEKSKMFVIERIRNIREKYGLYKYDDDMEVALISFIYNIGSPVIGMDRYIENNHINGLKSMMKKYSYAGGTYMRGLYKRRLAETNLF